MDRRRAEAIRRVLNTLEAYEGFREALQDYQSGTPDTTTLTITNTLDGVSVSETVVIPKGLDLECLMYDIETEIMDAESALSNL